MDVHQSGKMLRHMFGGSGHRSILRIGPAGERGSPMAGYATGEVFFVSQALGLRHSHLDAGGYSFDQKAKDRNAGEAVNFLLEDERERVLLTSMASCLFARSVYKEELLTRCLRSVEYSALADNLKTVSRRIQNLRWKIRLATGFRPQEVHLPKRFTEIHTWKGGVDERFLNSLKGAYAEKLLELGSQAV
jgi:aldehyde:ferredoxin oxidoreductase